MYRRGGWSQSLRLKIFVSCSLGGGGRYFSVPRKIGEKVPKSYFLSLFHPFWAYFGVCTVLLSYREGHVALKSRLKFSISLENPDLPILVFFCFPRFSRFAVFLVFFAFLLSFPRSSRILI